MERLDKILGNMGFGSRKDIKISVKKGLVTVNGIVAKDPGMKADPLTDVIVIDGEEIVYRKYIYLLMNKPAGVVSATFDNHDTTVVDLLPFDYKAFEPFPVGRLDKDTVGLLLLTNDGELNHRLLAPKSHVDKVYYVNLENEADESDVEAFRKGLEIDGRLQVHACRPCDFQRTTEGKSTSQYVKGSSTRSRGCSRPGEMK